MPSLTRLFLGILVALSCASLKEVHASFNLNPHDSFAYQTELGPLIRRAEPSASTPPPPNVRTATFFRHRIDQTSNPNFISPSYNRLVKKDVRICTLTVQMTTTFLPTACGVVSTIQSITVWTRRKSLVIHISAGYHQHLLLQQHTVVLYHLHLLKKTVRLGLPALLQNMALHHQNRIRPYVSSFSIVSERLNQIETTQEFEQWCKDFTRKHPDEYQECLENRRENWKREKRCAGNRPYFVIVIALPSCIVKVQNSLRIRQNI
jgi:hypothetical protein